MKKYISLLYTMAFILMEGLIFSTVQAESPPPLLWSQTYDGGSWDYANGVAIDAGGNIVVVGVTHTGTGTDWVIRKYSPNGILQWSQTFNGGHTYDVVIDAGGNIIVAGATSNGGNYDWLIRKYSADGTPQWSQTYDGGSWNEACGVAIDAGDNIIVAGSTGNDNSSDWLLCKYSPNGTLQWSQTYDGGLRDFAYGVAIDAGGNIIVAGSTGNDNSSDWLIRKYSANGTPQWSQTYDGGYGDGAYGVAIDAGGNIIVAGSTGNDNGSDWLIRKYSSDGTSQWSQTYDGGFWDEAYGVAIDAGGNIIVAGVTGNNNGSDWLIRKYSTDGTPQWSQTYDGGSRDFASSVAMDANGNIVVAGSTGNDTNTAWLIRKYGEVSSASVTPAPNNSTPKPGDTVCVQVNIANVSDLYATSFDLVYNPAVLDYTGITTCGLLGQNVSLQAAPLNGDERTGRIVVGISRLGDTNGVSGSGCLANLCFTVIGSYCSESDILFSNASLECPAQGCEISATWNSGSLRVTIGAPTNPVTADPGTHNQINLCWDTVSGATSYEVYRSNASGGVYTLIGTTANTCYQDTGCILPTLNYYYQVKAVSGGTCVSALSQEVSGLAAGLLGDINNDGRVNGRDLSRLARKFGTSDDCRANLDRSGLIDGDDLSLLAADFGKTL